MLHPLADPSARIASFPLLFDDLKEMMELCAAILAERNALVILTTYAVRASHLALYELCREVFSDNKAVESGELVIQEENNGRKIATSLYCRIRK